MLTLLWGFLIVLGYIALCAIFVYHESLWHRWLCFVTDHQWVKLFEEGKITSMSMTEEGISVQGKITKYKTYCRRCGKVKKDA